MDGKSEIGVNPLSAFHFKENGCTIATFLLLSHFALSPIVRHPHSRFFHYIQPIGTSAQWISVLFGHFPMAFQYFQEVHRGYPINFAHFPVTFLPAF
jgi:hypothetical protein